MTVSLPAAFSRWFVFSLLLFGLRPARAFQLADGAAPAAGRGVKYIFYWDQYQCDLTPENGFKGLFQLAPAAFRTLLLSAPSLWNGSSLDPAISFRIEGKAVVATRGRNDYAEQIGELDAYLSPRITPGQTLHLTDLVLSGAARGAIDIVIQAPESSNGGGRNTAFEQSNTYLNEQLLQYVAWGREDIYEVSNRDFFTETEFWQTIGQLPYVDWLPGIEPQPVSVSVSFLDAGAPTHGIAYPLDDNQYRQMVQYLKHYRHLVRPGAVIQCRMYTSDRYDELFRRTMTIVADNDPRLSLRRDRDAHQLRIQWGAWTLSLKNRYLLQLPAARGEALTVDPPVFLPETAFSGELADVLSATPECRVDGQFYPGLSFRLSIPADSFELEAVRDPLPDSLIQTITSRYGRENAIRLDHFQVPGLDLPPIECWIRPFALRSRQLTRNEFAALNAAPGSARIKLYAPVFTDHGCQIDFELPEPAAIQISVFEPEGWNTFATDLMQQAGRHSVRIPVESFRKKGKHFIFLNTPFGVAKQEILW